MLFKIDGIASKISWLMLSRWSVGAYGALVNINEMVPRGSDGNPLSNIPFEGSDVYNLTWNNLTLNWLMLGLQALIYLTITFWLQKRKNIL